MTDKQTKPPVSNERGELLKGAQGQPKQAMFASQSNQMFARTQSTPLEDQKKLSFGTGAAGGSLKTKLKLTTNAFVPVGPSNTLAASFLSEPQNPVTTSTAQSSNAYIPTAKPTISNGPGAGAFHPATTAPQTTTSQPFVPSDLKVQPTVTTSDKSAVKPAESTTPTASESGEAKKSSLKSKLKLTSTVFTAPSIGGSGTPSLGVSAPFEPAQKTFTPQATSTGINFNAEKAPVSFDKGPAVVGEWGSKPINKAAAEEKEKAKTSTSPSKIALKGHQYENNKTIPPQKNQSLEPILESKAENKTEAAAKVEQVPENKKPEPVKEVKSPAKDQFHEVKPKHKYAPRTTGTTATPTTTITAEKTTVAAPVVSDKPAAKVEPKKEVPKPTEIKKEEPVKVAETKKVEVPVKVSVVQPAAETKKAEPAKPVEAKKVEAPVKKVAEEEKREEKPAAKREEVVVLSRVKFEEMIEDLKTKLKDKRLPDTLQSIKDRVIAAEQARQKQAYTKGGKDNKGGFDRDNRERERPQQQAQEIKQQQQQDSGFGRSDTVRKTDLPDLKKDSSIFRVGLTEEEKRIKENLHKNVNAWIQGKKGEKDPEEVTRKTIKFNLNIITMDNFDVIKDIILNIAAEKNENCRKVAEFLIENAWTQKQYVNIYAKLCDYMGRSDRLYFDIPGGKPDTKKKNSFKLHIMKQIQTVFEDDTNINLGFKKPFEELDEAEKGLYFAKKKQRILGNVSFIGELFLEKFLVIGLMRIITKSLLQRFIDEYAVFQRAEVKPKNRSYEDTLEGLIKFYEIIGKSVEDKEATKPVDKAKSAANVQVFQKIIKQINDGKTPIESIPKLGEDELSLEDLFRIFNFMLEEANVSTRLDSLIKNLVHKKENKWAASISKNQGPKTIEEIHREFEREQMEMERRADEYREELYSQPRYSKPANQRTEVVFQVASSSKAKQAEETKLDTKSIEVDSNISFRPQRGKKGQEESKSASKKPVINPEEVENNLKDVYKLAQGEEIEDKTSPQEELKKLIAKIGGKEVLLYYFRTFYDGKIEDVKKRLFVPGFLMDEKAIEGEDFLNAFQRIMNKMYDYACDFPGSEKYFAVLILEYCRKLGNGSPLKNIQFSDEFYENEESELILEFYQDFFRALLKNLSTDFADLKGQISDEELKDFAKKIKVDDYDSFKKKI